MTKGELLYEGKAKKVYKTDDSDILHVVYKDDATAFNGQKKGSIDQKGYYNNQISAFLFQFLAEKGVENHFVELVGDREMLIKKLEIIPVEVVVRNVTAGNMAKSLGLGEGIELEGPLVEYYYKNDELGDPLINDDHIKLLKVATAKEVTAMREIALEVNQLLKPYFKELGIKLIDYKLEFGRYQGDVLLGDEISPDTCRFWDIKTGDKLDKDRFRRGLGGEKEAYAEILSRLKGGSVNV